jgi:hypothetical protein
MRMKALELTVYPKLERPMWGHQIEGYRQQVRAESELREAKRLTDAELAAEYWAPIWLTMPDMDWDADYETCVKQMKDRAATLLRFATLPHYDEDPMRTGTL